MKPLETISATEARVHFGKLLQRVAADEPGVVIQRSGTPQAVVLSIAEYERLVSANEATTGWREGLLRTRRLVRQGLRGRGLPPAEAMIELDRQERDAAIEPNLR